MEKRLGGCQTLNLTIATVDRCETVRIFLGNRFLHSVTQTQPQICSHNPYPISALGAVHDPRADRVVAHRFLVLYRFFGRVRPREICRKVLLEFHRGRVFHIPIPVVVVVVVVRTISVRTIDNKIADYVRRGSARAQQIREKRDLPPRCISDLSSKSFEVRQGPAPVVNTPDAAKYFT